MFDEELWFSVDITLARAHVTYSQDLAMDEANVDPRQVTGMMSNTKIQNQRLCIESVLMEIPLTIEIESFILN